jgi:hypothetical protein
LAKPLDFTTVAPREVAPGYLGRYIDSDHITQGRVDIAPGAVIPDHQLSAISYQLLAISYWLLATWLTERRSLRAH